MSKALVAKSYESLEQTSEPYEVNGRSYVNVRMKSGKIKTVRAYTPSEYAKFYPEVKIINPGKSRREILGFGEAGFIWLMKGAKYEDIDWYRQSPCRYARPWGWYLPSDIEMPNPLPVGVEPVKLMWEDVSFNGQLIPEDQIAKVADRILYEAGTSKHVGKIGDRLDIKVVCSKAVTTENAYGENHFYVFTDADGIIYTWSTSARILEEGRWYHVRGTLKEHSEYHAQAQNVLTRCRAEDINGAPEEE